MTNEQQLEAIKNSIATINNCTNYCIETKIDYDKNDKFLINSMFLKVSHNCKATGIRHIQNK